MSAAMIRWLGQAGFALTSPLGVRVAVDPYLSDSCMRLVGFKRMTAAPVSVADFDTDMLLISHEHPDHLDIDLARRLSASQRFPIYANAACRAALKSAGLSCDMANEIRVGSEISLGDVRVRCVPADHGSQCPGALGFLIDLGDVRVYFAGDTAYTPELLSAPLAARPDAALLPINGQYGNLGWAEASRLACELGCHTVIPCHFGMFVEHGGNPLEFASRMAEAAPAVRALFLAPGETALCAGRDGKA